jgi:hypothetical protein
MSNSIYSTTTPRKSKKTSNTLYTKSFIVNLSKSPTLKQAWYGGTLPGCTYYKVMCKIINSLLWNEICSKKNVVGYMVCWYRMHHRKFDYAIVNRALEFVYEDIKVDRQVRWAEAKRKQRDKQKAAKIKAEERALLIEAGLISGE